MAYCAQKWSVGCTHRYTTTNADMSLICSVPTPPKPFRIITGVGKHSTNHVAILRPGVAKALENDGWRVDRGTSDRGYILVRGVQGA